MHARRWRNLNRIGARQEQLVTVQQAMGCGIPRSTFVQSAKRLGMSNLGGGVWAQPGAPNTYRRKLWVARLLYGDEVIFTARSALWLRRIISASPPQVEVHRGPAAHDRPRPGLRLVRARWREEDETVNLEGFRVAPTYRAFTDVASVVPLESLVRWLPAMDRLRLGTLEGLRQYISARGRFVGAVNLVAAVAVLKSDLPHSGAERFARRTIRTAGLVPHPRP